MSFTVTDLLDALNEGKFLEDNWDELGWTLKYHSIANIEINGTSYPIEVLESSGDGEWAYDTLVIFKVGDRVFRKTGRFESHYGNDWEGPLEEVHQVKKLVKVWEAV